MKRSFAALAAFGILAVTLAACEGFKEAMTAHVDVAAKAGSQELSVDRLGTLLSHAKVPPNPQIAKAITDLWVDYQLLGQAAARDDSLRDPKLVDKALWPVITQERVAKWHDQIAKSFTGIDTTNLEARYNQGELLAARHILLLVPPKATPAERDSIRKRAETIRAEATSANFADLAKKNSQDTQSAVRGGDLGLFPKGMMVKPFEQAVLALKPGEISPVVETQFGYHIIRRSTYPEVKEQFDRAVNAGAMRTADSLYITKLEAAGDIKIRDNAVSTVRAAAKDLDAHANDDAVIATSKAGNFTVGRLVHWVDAYGGKAQVEQQLPQLPDSVVDRFLHGIIRNELVLHEADSAKVELDATEIAKLHDQFAQVVSGAWDQLGVSPKELADSAKTEPQREHVAADRVDQYLDKLMTQQARYVDVPEPVETVLREKYDWKVNTASLDRAVARAAKLRAAADSAQAKSEPKSEVPLGAPQPVKPDTGKH